MTEKEVINALKADEEYLIDHNICDAEEIQIAIQAVKEVEKYRKIKERLQAVYGECDGLLETFIAQAIENAVSILEDHDGVDIGHPYRSRLLTDEDVDKWEAYKVIGTPDECRAAMEKQKAKTVTDIHVDEYRCPACGSENTTSDTLTVGDHYCPNCGQRLE